MKSIIRVLVSIVVGFFGYFLCFKQRAKTKTLEKKNEVLKEELEQQNEQAIISQLHDTAHVNDLGIVVSADKHELEQRANNLFCGTKTLGGVLYDYRRKNGWSLNTLSKKTGYTAAQLSTFEKDNGLSKDVVEKLSKAFSLTKEEKKKLLDMLEEKE